MINHPTCPGLREFPGRGTLTFYNWASPRYAGCVGQLSFQFLIYSPNAFACLLQILFHLASSYQPPLLSPLPQHIPFYFLKLRLVIGNSHGWRIWSTLKVNSDHISLPFKVLCWVLVWESQRMQGRGKNRAFRVRPRPQDPLHHAPMPVLWQWPSSLTQFTRPLG